MDDQQARIDDLEARLRVVMDRQQLNGDRIKANQVRSQSILAMLVFSAIVWGIPIAEVKWSGKEFSFTRDTTDPSLILIGGLVAASLFAGDKPMDLIKALIQQKIK